MPKELFTKEQIKKIEEIIEEKVMEILKTRIKISKISGVPAIKIE